MKSSLPKVMHPVGGRPMVDWSIALAQDVGCTKIIVVVGPTQTELTAHIHAKLGAGSTAIQSPALGTGHAVLCAKEALADFEGDVVVLYGDTPLIPAGEIKDLFAQLSAGASVGVLGFIAENPGAYGRLVVNSIGGLDAIIEAKEATPEQLAIDFCNSGVMAASAETMFRHLENVTNDNAKGEYYLTDLVSLARAAGETCSAVSCFERDVLGVNSRVELAQAESIFQNNMRQTLLVEGVTMLAPETVFFSYDTEIENDVTLEQNIVFGPNVTVKTGAVIRAFSHLEGAHVASNAVIGPYARLRPGADIGENAKIGNFVEVKKTRVGAGAKANHLSYLGDGEIGAGANIGAGTIFCNYDGYLKYQTIIGEGAFVGSNSSLVAPITIGPGAIVGSGSVVTKDVPSDALAVGRGRQIQREGWAVNFRAQKSAEKAAKK